MKTNKEIKTIGKQKIERPFGQILLYINIVRALEVIGNIIPVLGFALISATLKLGYIDSIVTSESGEKTSVLNLFKYFKYRWGDAFYLTVSTTLYMWPVYVLAVISTIIYPLASILIPIMIIVAIVRDYDCAMGVYLLYKDNNLTGKEALQTSIKLMKGHKFDLFKLELRLLGYYIINVFLNYGQPTIDACKIEFFEEIFVESTTTIAE